MNNYQQGTSTSKANKIPSFYEDVLYTRYIISVQIGAQYFPQLKTAVVLNLWRAGHKRKGSTRSVNHKRKHDLGL